MDLNAKHFDQLEKAINAGDMKWAAMIMSIYNYNLIVVGPGTCGSEQPDFGDGSVASEETALECPLIWSENVVFVFSPSDTNYDVQVISEGGEQMTATYEPGTEYYADVSGFTPDEGSFELSAHEGFFIVGPIALRHFSYAAADALVDAVASGDEEAVEAILNEVSNLSYVTNPEEVLNLEFTLVGPDTCS
jgi:hypothetical protein